MNKNIENTFENNWEIIKDELKLIWPKLTYNDIKQIEGSYDAFKDKLKKYYKITKDEIDDELNDFFSSEVDELKNEAKKHKENAEHDIYSLTGVIGDCVYQYLQNIKEKAITIEDNIIQYAKENPIKILGIAAIASYSLSKSFRSSDPPSK